MKDNRLVKKVMFGMIEGQMRRGRLCRELLDDIKEWRGGHPHTQQEGAGSRHVENGSEDDIGQLRALSPWSNGWVFQTGTTTIQSSRNDK